MEPRGNNNCEVGHMSRADRGVLAQRTAGTALAGLVAVAASVLLSGCSASISIGSHNLDTSKVEQEITSELKAAVGTTDVAVTCPDDVEVKAGATTECTATVGDQTAAYTVTITDDQGNFTAKRVEAIIDLDRAQSTIADQLESKIGGKWSLSCDPAGADRIYVVAVDETFTCTAEGTNAEGRAQTGDIVVTVDDTEGNVSWEIGQ
jgi:hypothetical protein